jgi:transcriptional regulator with XRE-family HTH domain
MKVNNAHPLRRERLRKGWTQQELADFAQVSLSSIERAERGKPLRVDICKRICITLGKEKPEELDLLYCGEEEENRRNNNNGSYRDEAQDDSSALLSKPENSMNRRDFTRGVLQIASTAFLAHEVLNDELLERFFRALEKPSTIDENFLRYLEMHSKNYWRDHYYAIVTSGDLLSYSKDHFKKITELLEGSLFPQVRMRLCSIASSTALLVGTLFFDTGDYKNGGKFFKAAIIAGQEASDYLLQAVGWGWMSLDCMYDGDIQAAHTCIQTARHLATWSTSITARTWLAAVNAEILAKLHHYDACRRALDDAELLEDAEQPQQVHYWTSYDRLQLEGYKGTCFRLLYQPENTQTHAYLISAQKALKEALTQTDPVLTRLQSIFLSDLAGTYIKQREVGEACNIARQALIVNTPKSQMLVQRVLTLRNDLEPWKNTQEVRALDAHLMPLLTSRSYYRGTI